MINYVYVNIIRFFLCNILNRLVLENSFNFKIKSPCVKKMLNSQRLNSNKIKHSNKYPSYRQSTNEIFSRIKICFLLSLIYV